MSESEPPPPSPESKALAHHAFFEDLDARLSAAGYAVPPAAAPPPPPPVLTFDAWAELAVRFLDSPEEALVEALAARGLTLDVWRPIDRDYHRALSDDARAGQGPLTAIYEAKYKEAGLPRAATLGAPAPIPEAPAEGPPPPPCTPAPARFRGTNGAPDLSSAVMKAMGRMPFDPPAPAPAAPAKRSAKTVQSKAVKSPVGRETMDVSGALPRPTPSLPFAGSSGGPGVVHVPTLSAHQYVSLCAELALNTAPRDETLRRYHVPNEASSRALQDHWQHLATPVPPRRARGRPGRLRDPAAQQGAPVARGLRRK